MKYFGFIFTLLLIVSCTSENGESGGGEESDSFNIEAVKNCSSEGFVEYDLEKLPGGCDTISRSVVYDWLGEVEVAGKAGAAFDKAKLGQMYCIGWEEVGGTFYFAILQALEQQSDLYVACVIDGDVKTVNHFGTFFQNEAITMTTKGKKTAPGEYEVKNYSITYTDEWQDGKVVGRWKKIQSATMIHKLVVGRFDVQRGDTGEKQEYEEL